MSKKEFSLEDLFGKLFKYPTWDSYCRSIGKPEGSGLRGTDICNLHEQQQSTLFFRTLHYLEEGLPRDIMTRWHIWVIDPIDYIRIRFIDRRHLIDTKLSKGDWHDQPERLRHAIFESLVEFIQKEHPWGKGGHIDEIWEGYQKENDIYYKEHPNEYEREKEYLEENKVFRNELVEAYVYWTEGRQILEHNLDVITNDAYKLESIGQKDFWYFMKDLDNMTDEERIKSRERSETIFKLENEISENDKKYMCLIIKHYERMWT